MSEPRDEILISRIVGGDASDSEWRELDALADQDPTLWRRLGEAQRDHASLARAVNGAVAIADSIPLPSSGGGLSRNSSGRSLRLHGISAWSGWSVAALIAVVASVQLSRNQPVPFPGVDSNQTTLNPIATAADAWQAYLDKGRASGDVIAEVPTKVLLDSRPAAEGEGYEVFFLRQVLERAIVPDLYQVSGQNDAGQPTLVRYQQPARERM